MALELTVEEASPLVVGAAAVLETLVEVSPVEPVVAGQLELRRLCPSWCRSPAAGTA
ncbi:hypothetical protein OV079_28070 [Nannocystis pusilla]|uniref:Uncharacterized protein n=1 Tax=Nannocystis pusilla TaxID=889268 RepID=A0A9X3ESF0_9BACT|nr:hypothetical protein [Nannocystis pusilla]MCY1009353.1 hypothetical protein [Nannocystis pusilla]